MFLRIFFFWDLSHLYRFETTQCAIPSYRLLGNEERWWHPSSIRRCRSYFRCPAFATVDDMDDAIPPHLLAPLSILQRCYYQIVRFVAFKVLRVIDDEVGHSFPSARCIINVLCPYPHLGHWKYASTYPSRFHVDLGRELFSLLIERRDVD